MKIPFKKPTHWTNGRAWINIDVDKVRKAKKRREMVEVILPEGECKPIDPNSLLKYGKRTEAVFLYPDNPMKLVGAYYELKTEEDKWKEFSKQCL